MDPLGFEADEADFNITLPTMDDKSSCLGTITSITSMTGRLPRCSQHESPGESGGPPSRRSGAEVCPLPTRIDFVVADALGTTIKSTSMASLEIPACMAPAGYGSGQVLSPIYGLPS